MKTELMPGESLVRDGKANMQLRPLTAGGHLYLTNRRLIFESHGFNIQRGAADIPLEEIAGVTRERTQMFNAIPLTDNSIGVQTRGGGQFRFVVFGREEWIPAIERARAGEEIEGSTAPPR
jgi:hypothetical protein